MRIASVDTGGTFTDIVCVDTEGEVSVYKGLTTPSSPEVGILRGLQQFGKVERVVHATTIATNALLGQVNLDLPSVALFTTEGFGDVIEIGRQNRPELYNPYFKRPRPIVPRSMRFEVPERTDFTGRVVKEVDEGDVREKAKRALEMGSVSVAVSFLHSYANPQNEVKVGNILKDYFAYISLSHHISPYPREYERTATTVVNAALMPLVKRYLDRLTESLRGLGVADLQIMSSSGGIVDSEEASHRPVQVIESGPAAGVIGTSTLSRSMGIERAISFDMGGTTAKAGTVIGGAVETTTDYEVGGRTHYGRVVKGTGYPIRFPFVDLAEVSSGGGTIIWRDAGGALKVGPLSAGADPGPMSYNMGGDRPTLTDACLFLNRLPEELPSGLRLYRDLAERGLRTLGDPEEVSVLALKLASLEMARAIRLVTVERGLDPSAFTLFAFGGMGPLFALDLAEEVGINTVVVPPHPGLFSAMGMLFSDVKFEASSSYPKDLGGEFKRLEDFLRKKVGEVDKFERYADVRYEGQGWEITVPVTDLDRVREAFEKRHKLVYGFTMDYPIEIVSIRVFAVRRGMGVETILRNRTKVEGHTRERRVHDGGKWVVARVMRRESLIPSQVIRGPAVLEEYSSTTFIRAGWTGTVHDNGSLVLRRGE